MADRFPDHHASDGSPANDSSWLVRKGEPSEA
jgi:hypothetical protein